MTAAPLYYELPANLTAKKFFRKLEKIIDHQIKTQSYCIKTFYDTFDWRLYNSQLLCEFSHSQAASQLVLINTDTGEPVARQEMQNIPKFHPQFPMGSLRDQLAASIGIRALLPLCQLPHQLYLINILNKDQKTVVRLKLEEHESLTNKLSLYPLKGYEKAAKKVAMILKNDLNLLSSDCTATLVEALNQLKRKPGDYSSKLKLKIKPDMQTEKAANIIFRNLLKGMKANEAGTIDDIDTEFLHDFRVAVRRTRAAFHLFKHILPAYVISAHAPLFSWLGQITGPTRDFDVYLLNYPQYEAALPPSLREELVPFYHFLKQKQQQAQKELAEKLQSDEYKRKIISWEEYLQSSKTKQPKDNNSNLTIKQLADQRTWKVYRRLLKDGNAISDTSPPEALHDLRKTAKKLRYLMEFFQGLYPKKDINQLIKALKNFQTVLGNFQDYDVQENNIKHFSEEMLANNINQTTFLALGVLIQNLDGLKQTARRDFAHQFAVFKEKENHLKFKQLFARKGKI